MKPAIEIKDLGKEYTIFHERASYYSLRDEISSLFSRKNSQKEKFWALKDVSFNVEQGEILGIIGPNGAGKSTLLKILSQITPPTRGSLVLRGSVGSLLEVGTGFHPELSGRENIFLNGAILGMSRKEISRKFDEIIDFAGVEKFLDTPVKYYSSGMYVRLAFAVAAHMDPEILIIDEVLAVGDTEFQKKCLGKMEEITKKQGRTIIFVSHNMEAIRRLCSRCVLLENGVLKNSGQSEDIIDEYLKNNVSLKSKVDFVESTQVKDARLISARIFNSQQKVVSEVNHNEDFYIEADFEVKEKSSFIFSCGVIKDSGYYFIVSENDGTAVSGGNKLVSYDRGFYTARIKIDRYLLPPGIYELELGLQEPFVRFLDRQANINFKVLENNYPQGIFWRNQPIARSSPLLEVKIIKK